MYLTNIKQNTNLQLVLKRVKERRKCERFHLFDNGDLTFSKCDLKWQVWKVSFFFSYSSISLHKIDISTSKA